MYQRQSCFMSMDNSVLFPETDRRPMLRKYYLQMGEIDLVMVLARSSGAIKSS